MKEASPHQPVLTEGRLSPQTVHLRSCSNGVTSDGLLEDVSRRRSYVTGYHERKVYPRVWLPHRKPHLAGKQHTQSGAVWNLPLSSCGGFLQLWISGTPTSNLLGTCCSFSETPAISLAQAFAASFFLLSSVSVTRVCRVQLLLLNLPQKYWIPYTTHHE